MKRCRPTGGKQGIWKRNPYIRYSIIYSLLATSKPRRSRGST